MGALDLLVVGGGISGMTAAFRAAQRGGQAVVLERSDAPGGCIHSARLPSGFWFELGAHTCYSTYGGLLGMLEARDALGTLRPRQKAPFRLLARGRVRSIASQLGIASLLLHAPRILFAKKAGQTVRGYYGGLVGEGNYERVFGPLFAAVPSQRADDFPAEMLFKSRPRRKDVPRSFTLDGGLSTIFDVVAQTPGLKVIPRAEVVSLTRDGGRFTATQSDGRTHQAAQVLLAVPPVAAAKLAAAVAPRAAEALSRIACSTVRSVGVVVRRDSTALEPVTGIIPLDDQRFFSCVSRDTVPDETFRGFAFHMKPGVGREDALAAIASVLQVDATHFVHVEEREVTLPSPKLGHDATVRAIDEGLAGLPLGIAGNFFAGLSIEDCVQRADAEVSRLAALA